MINVAPPTQDTWCSNDYGNAVRLVECKIVCFHLVSSLTICRCYRSYDYGITELATNTYYIIPTKTFKFKVLIQKPQKQAPKLLKHSQIYLYTSFFFKTL